MQAIEQHRVADFGKCEKERDNPVPNITRSPKMFDRPLGKTSRLGKHFMPDSDTQEILIKTVQQNELLREQNVELNSKLEGLAKEQKDHFAKYNLLGLSSEFKGLIKLKKLLIVASALVAIILILMGIAVLSLRKSTWELTNRATSKIVSGRRVLTFSQKPSLEAIRQKSPDAFIVSADEWVQCQNMCTGGEEGGRVFLSDYIPYRSGTLNAASDLTPGPKLINSRVFVSVSGMHLEGRNGVGPGPWKTIYSVETEAKSDCFRIRIKAEFDTLFLAMNVDWVAVGE